MAPKARPQKGSTEPRRTIGPYILGRVRSERDLLATYAAENPSLARTALVRTTAPSVALADRSKRRLTAEALLVTKAAGQGVALLYDAAPDGSYYAMEDPEGPSLDELLHAEKPTEITGPAAMALVARMATSLATVHAAGLVHAAIEPSAFFLSPRRTLVLAGFDRARAADAPAEIDAEPERGAASVAYASPEQLVGDPVTPASDVFSVGVVAYELLAGVHPFAAELVLGGTEPRAPGDIAHRIRTERPPPMPAERRIPIDLERLIQRALGKSPGHRPASGAELAKEIASIPMPDERDAELHKLFGKLGLSESKSATTVLSHAHDGSDDEAPREPSVRPIALRLGALFAAMIAVGTAFQVVDRMDTDGDKSARSNGPGYVRVLAHPWAEVWVDGALVDTTPIGRPLSLASGRHTFLFKHPRAEEERRLVDVAPDTTTTLDVTMRVARPPPDAGVDASP